MADEAGRHFASDEEILSRYVLGRLDGNERAVIDNHAAVCDTCREALRREMELAAGVRRLGRENLKKELRRRIAEDSSPGLRVRALSAAAAVCIVAGLGVYYAFFRRAEILPQDAGRAPALANRTESFAQGRADEPASRIDQKTAPEKSAETLRGAGIQSGAKMKQSALPGEQDRAGGAKRESPAADITAPAHASGDISSEPSGEFWSEGIVESPGAVSGAAPAPSGFAAQKKDLAPPAGNPARVDDRLMKEEQKAQADETDHLKGAYRRSRGEYLIRQKPASTLPSERAGRDQSRVPTRVDQRGNRTTMTMYLDSLVDEKDLQNAQVDAASGDSVVVTVGGKKILYRFPSGQAAEQRQK